MINVSYSFIDSNNLVEFGLILSPISSYQMSPEFITLSLWFWCLPHEGNMCLLGWWMCHYLHQLIANKAAGQVVHREAAVLETADCCVKHC